MIELIKSLSPIASPIIFLIQLLCTFLVLLLATKFVTRKEHEAEVEKHNLLKGRIDDLVTREEHEKEIEERKKLDDQVSDVKGQTALFDREITYIKEKMGALPTAKDLHELSISITKLQGSLETNSVQMVSLQKQVNLLDGYLREMGK